MEDSALVPLNPPSECSTPQLPDNHHRKTSDKRPTDSRRRRALKRQQTSFSDDVCHSIDEPSLDSQPELRESQNNGQVYVRGVDQDRYTSIEHEPNHTPHSDDITAPRHRKSKCKNCECCFPKCRKRRKAQDDLSEDDIREIEALKDPPRKRCLRACFNFLYILLAIIAIVVTYSMIQDLVTAMRNPVRSIKYKRVENYEAPGIAVYPGGAKFLACGHYYNNVVTSKVRLSQLDLVNRNCSFKRLLYEDPHYPGVERDVLVVRGPTSFVEREAIFLHFELVDNSRDFFTVSYFVFPEWDAFNGSERAEQVTQILDYHRYVPTFALSSGLRMWIKLIMSEDYLMDDTKNTDFRVEYSVVKFWDRRAEAEKDKHLFFIFFEWKNDLIEQSYLLYTTTPWSIGAGLCGVFLTLHRGYQLAQTSYKRMQKEKRRRTIRKRTIMELKRQRTLTSSQDGEGSNV